MDNLHQVQSVTLVGARCTRPHRVIRRRMVAFDSHPTKFAIRTRATRPYEGPDDTSGYAGFPGIH